MSEDGGLFTWGLTVSPPSSKRVMTLVCARKHSPWKKALQTIKKKKKKKASHRKKAQKSTTVLLKALATIPV